jgi:hypothetical protein
MGFDPTAPCLQTRTSSALCQPPPPQVGCEHELAARLLSAAATESDPYDFVGSFESDMVGARDVDAFLRERGLGAS